MHPPWNWPIPLQIDGWMMNIPSSGANGWFQGMAGWISNWNKGWMFYYSECPVFFGGGEKVETSTHASSPSFLAKVIFLFASPEILVFCTTQPPQSIEVFMGPNIYIRTRYLEEYLVGPLPVVSKVVTPLVAVITPVTYLLSAIYRDHISPLKTRLGTRGPPCKDSSSTLTCVPQQVEMCVFWDYSMPWEATWNLLFLGVISPIYWGLKTFIFPWVFGGPKVDSSLWMVYTRWAPYDRYKWSSSPYKWLYNWVTRVISPINGAVTLLITGDAAQLAGIQKSWFCHNPAITR